MNQATDNPSDPFVTKSMLDARIKETEAWVTARFDVVDFRLNSLDAKMDAGFADLNRKFDYVIGVLDGYLKRMEDNDTNNAARDTQLDRHDRWHRQVAGTLHLKLE
jgi:hypothetical protein